MEILGELIRGILLILPGFVFSILVAMLYECKISQLLKGQRNKVHFYMARDKSGRLWLYIGKPIRGINVFYSPLGLDFMLPCSILNHLGLNKNDYDFLKWEDEPVEVFINMED